MRASCEYTLHARQGGGYYIGTEGDTFEVLVAELLGRYGDRLLRAVDKASGEVREFDNKPETGER